MHSPIPQPLRHSDRVTSEGGKEVTKKNPKPKKPKPETPHPKPKAQAAICPGFGSSLDLSATACHEGLRFRVPGFRVEGDCLKGSIKVL